MPRFTDEQLVAYADGELPAAEAAAIRAEARSDAAVARRIEGFIASRRILRQAFAASLDEAPPARLLQLLETPAPPVVAVRRRMPRRSTWIGLALAASVALTIGVGLRLRGPMGATATTPMIASANLDPAVLAEAMERKLSGEPLQTGPERDRLELMPTATLRTAAGGYCREFEMARQTAAGAERSQGIACRQADSSWQLKVIARTDSGSSTMAGNYLPASGSGIDLRGALGAAEQVTPDAEKALVASGWTPPAPAAEHPQR